VAAVVRVNPFERRVSAVLGRIPKCTVAFNELKEFVKPALTMTYTDLLILAHNPAHTGLHFIRDHAAVQDLFKKIRGGVWDGMIDGFLSSFSETSRYRRDMRKVLKTITTARSGRA
jgi:hypothetical protein